MRENHNGRVREASRHVSGASRNAPARLELFLFLSLWCAYGLALNSGNLEAFKLQQIGVEAMVERGNFHLEGSPTPGMQPAGDTFVYRGRRYAAKQPGQFMAGALVYFPLHALGLSYLKNYLLASALVTFFTTSLATALSAIALFRLAKDFVKDGSALFWPLAATFTYALATTAFTYSGVAHHDALASAYLVIAFYLVDGLAREGPGAKPAGTAAVCAGLLLGMTLTTSMLTFFMAVAVGLYFVAQRKWRLLPHFILGGLAGVAPLLVYNAASFGNPLLMPNVAGDYQDTFFHLELKNFAAKLGFYGRMLTLYVPVFWLGLAGLFFFPRGRARERTTLALLISVLALHVLNIGADGACQYGPRYLLPAMPYASLGLAGFSFISGRRAKLAAAAFVFIAALVSFLVSLAGALQGAMFCEFVDRHAFWPALDAMRRGQWRTHPLAAWLAVPFLLSAALLVRSLMQARRSGNSNHRPEAVNG